ncbi:MAG TPA: RDD family protein [Geothermobacteraceae bacterium]|nr:RDD family protein [Geothermobacteraceae bacterium]
MSDTTIVCPHCSFSRQVPEANIPQRTLRIVCPKCQERFAWQRKATPKIEAVEFDLPTMTCPACGERQPRQLACQGCGVVFSKLAKRNRPKTAAPRPSSPQERIARAPKAGFALRCAAAAIDTVVYLVVLLLVICGLSLIISTSGGDNPQALAMIGLLAGFVVLAFDYLYRVFFIGYCGQTPGKMTTRIKVVRCNGEEVGFGAAIFREVIGKFISTLLLLTGYIMVGFDEQHQGLHDKIADTYVIKL